MDTCEETHTSPSGSVELERTLGDLTSISPPPHATENLSELYSTGDAASIDLSRSASLFDSVTLDDLSPSSPFRAFSEPWPLLDDSNALESESDSKTSLSVPTVCDEGKPLMVGAGLANLGNTCFLNAVIQCFTHSLLLVRDLCSQSHSMPCGGNNDEFCLLCALREHIELSLTSTHRVISPQKFVDNLSYFSSSFQRYQQEDAHEFLQCFLDRLERCCNNQKSHNTGLFSLEDNIVKRLFGGRLVSRLRCCNCNHYSETYEPSVDLSLEIDHVDTLLNALDCFTKLERIEDVETKFTCEKCKEEVTIEKQLMLDQAPIISALHLKRFRNDGSYVEKIDKHVEFPLDLDLQPYNSGNQADLKYSLYAVIVHAAYTSTCGHYYCFIRSEPDAWYRFDDWKVVKVDEAYVLSQEAYILLYSKQGTPWFSSFLETFKPSMSPSMSHTSPKSVLDKADPVYASSPDIAKNHSPNVSETSEIAHEKISTVSFNRFRLDRIGVSEVRDGYVYRGMHDAQHPQVSNSADAVPRKVEKVFSPAALKEYNFHRELGQLENDVPKIPPRSPSPDIYKEEPSDLVFSAKHESVKSTAVERSCKRRLSRDLERDPMRREATRLCRMMPGNRCNELMAFIEESGSKEVLSSKKNKKPASTSNRDRYNKSIRLGIW